MGAEKATLHLEKGFGLSFFLCEPVANEGAEHVPTSLFVWTEAFCYKSFGNATGRTVSLKGQIWEVGNGYVPHQLAHPIFICVFWPNSPEYAQEKKLTKPRKGSEDHREGERFFDCFNVGGDILIGFKIPKRLAKSNI